MRSVIVIWDKMGAEFTYSVYYSKHIDGPWIRAHDQRLTDDIIDTMRAGYPHPYNQSGVGDEDDFTSSGFGLEPFGEGSFGGTSSYHTYNENLYMINGLDDDTIYHVKVEVNDKYHQWWYSYESQDSLGGGLSEPYTRPSVEASGFGVGPFGTEPFGSLGGFGEGPFGGGAFGEGVVSDPGFGNTRGLQFRLYISPFGEGPFGEGPFG